ncbi:MAG: hypothetical protein RI897_3593 [Verrucomicrobiota bacterium]|jgi:hypothetical protein
MLTANGREELASVSNREWTRMDANVDGAGIWRAKRWDWRVGLKH